MSTRSLADDATTRGARAGSSRRREGGYVCEPRARTIASSLVTLWQYRRLLYIFTWRDLRVRYKHTVMGAAWNLIQPLGLMLVFALVFGMLFQGRTADVPFPVFLYPALLLWGFFARSVGQGATSIESFQGLLNKIYFPRLIAPCAAVLGALVDLAIASSALVVLMAIYGLRPEPNLLLAPLFVLGTMVFGLGVAIWLSAIDAEYRDVRHTLPFVLQFWMFAAPVVYPVDIIPERWHGVYALNPMVGLVQGFRWTVIPGLPPPTVPMLIVSAIASVGLLWTGLLYFNAREGTLVDTV